MNFEALIAELNKRGFLLSSLYQRFDHEWFASIRRKGDFSSAHGEGTTAGAALSKAIANIKPAMTAADWQKVKVTRKQETRYRLGESKKE